MIFLQNLGLFKLNWDESSYEGNNFLLQVITGNDFHKFRMTRVKEDFFFKYFTIAQGCDYSSFFFFFFFFYEFTSFLTTTGFTVTSSYCGINTGDHVWQCHNKQNVDSTKSLTIIQFPQHWNKLYHLISCVKQFFLITMFFHFWYFRFSNKKNKNLFINFRLYNVRI